MLFLSVTFLSPPCHYHPDKREGDLKTGRPPGCHAAEPSPQSLFTTQGPARGGGGGGGGGGPGDASLTDRRAQETLLTSGASVKAAQDAGRRGKAEKQE